MPFKQPVSVLVVIHTPALEVVLLERTQHPGFWQSVTGSREVNENLPATAARELCEETGIEAPPERFIDWRLSNRFEIFPQWRHRYASNVTHNVEHVYSLCLPSPIPLQLAASEHRAYRWLPWRKAADECFSWTNRDAILMLPSMCGQAA